jgi:3-methyladenine DNA glycosylase/8-oxoguanine DNA glycosylase
MWVAPPAEAWRRIPSWEWHRAGVDGARSRTVLAAARVASALERTLAGAGVGAEVERVLRAVPGVGVWTAAEVAQRAHGDADAVSVGDLHVPGLVGWNLAGRLVDDDGMLELLAPYTPHRYRVQRLLETGGRWPPRRAPRMAVQDMRAF